MPVDFWMHSYCLFKFYFAATQETASLFLNKSITVASWPFITPPSSLLPALTSELSPICFFLCAMESLHDSSFISRTQSLPTSPYVLKKPCLGNPESKEGKDYLGQPLHEIIMEVAILCTSSNKLEELLQDRTVWVWLTCALRMGNTENGLINTQIRQAILRIYVDTPVKPKTTVMAFYLWCLGQWIFN